MSLTRLLPKHILFYRPATSLSLLQNKSVHQSYTETYLFSTSSAAQSYADLNSILGFGGEASRGKKLKNESKIDDISRGNAPGTEGQQGTISRTSEERRAPLLDSNTISSDGTMVPNESTQLTQDGVFKDVAWQMHVYAHRHNVHITIARPPAWRHPVTGKVYGENPPSRSVALSLCAGRLGFKHSGRKLYDSAFQLGTYVMARMQESGMNSYIEKLEVYLRGFGAGREAVTRVLLGVEGKNIRKKITKVADSTRLKIGGTRSANPRRLG